MNIPFGKINSIKEVSKTRQGMNMARNETQNLENTSRFSTIGFDITS